MHQGTQWRRQTHSCRVWTAAGPAMRLLGYLNDTLAGPCTQSVRHDQSTVCVQRCKAQSLIRSSEFLLRFGKPCQRECVSQLTRGVMPALHRDATLSSSAVCGWSSTCLRAAVTSALASRAAAMLGPHCRRCLASALESPFCRHQKRIGAGAACSQKISRLDGDRAISQQTDSRLTSTGLSDDLPRWQTQCDRPA